MKEPLVSIITPSYNSEQYIISTINSVLNQNYNNWEMIIVDDCSTDNSYDLIKKIALTDSRIKVFKNKVNSRAFGTRNHALEKVTGTFIAFLDADDLWFSNKLERQVNFMLDNNYYISYTAFKKFKNTIEDQFKPTSIPAVASYNSLICDNYIATSSVMINVEKTGPFRMRDVYYDDFTLWLELLGRVGNAYGLNEPLMHYRLTENSLSRNKFRSAIKVYGIFKNSLGLPFIKANYLFLKWALNTTRRHIFGTNKV